MNEDGSYELLVPPLFVKDLSVGDSLNISSDGDGVVDFWETVGRSKRSTIWVLFGDGDKKSYELIFEKLRAFGCNTVECPNYGLIAIDVPETLSREELEGLLDQFSEDDVGYPSYRHEE